MKRSEVNDSKDEKMIQMDYFPHPNVIFECENLEIRPGSVTERPNNCSNLVEWRKFVRIHEIPRKCKGFYSQPAAGRPGSDEISLEFPLKFLQIRLEASLGL